MSQIKENISASIGLMFEQVKAADPNYYARLDDAQVTEPGICTSDELQSLIDDAPTESVRGYLCGVLLMRVNMERMTGRAW